MIFVTGPLYAGKQAYICGVFGWDESDFQKNAVRDVQELASRTDDLQKLAEELSRYPVIIASEVGCGIVPTEPEARKYRESAGRLACMLAERADTVIRVCCGIPQTLKGSLPC